MKQSPYLLENRLQDVLAALQLMAAYPDYDLTLKDFREKMASEPRSAQDWSEVFAAHPEFFRQSERGGDYSLVLRRARPKIDGRRPPLSSAEISMLTQTAIDLQTHALEIRREQKAWIPLLLSAVGITAAFIGTILGALIKGK